ncbi:MAG: D-alanyl-D-alanine carboxypeptidase family protein [Clostridia bacterium]|nr:D-alanyl-D-alanine carboxypeptidase family protein [Clostridia bacterium]
MKKRILSAILMLTLIVPLVSVNISADEPFTIDAKSGILMEASSGKVLYEQNADEALPPASVTKIMTLLLVMEAVDNGTLKLTDMIRTSTNASSMGGSQIYLKEGEELSAEDMIKSVVISSANDAALALAEHIAGREELFVSKMNEKAVELGMKNTYFENTNGLDDTTEKHLTSARDIALMSAALIKHKKILDYSSIWMDSIRDGAFGLTNTNRLIRFYKGANGLKTGSTSKAGFCISATAERDGMTLIAVIMGSPTRDIRNAEATKLLDYGFANYALYSIDAENMGDIKVLGGTSDSCPIYHSSFSCVISSSDKDKIELINEIKESTPAPIKKGDKIGIIRVVNGDTELGTIDILCKKSVNKIDFFGIFMQIFRKFSLVE